MLGSLNHITGSSGITNLGIEEISYNGDNMTVFGYDTFFIITDMYWTKDDKKDIYYFTMGATLIQNPTLRVGIWDNTNKVFIFAYDASYLYGAISANTKNIINLNDENLPSSSTELSALPDLHNNNMLHMRGTSNYMYVDIYSCDGVKSNLVWIVGTPSGSAALADSFNTEVELDDGTVLTPIVSVGSGNANVKAWLAIKSSTSDSSYSRGGDTDEDIIEGA